MSRLEFLAKISFINSIIVDQDDNVKTEFLLPMTAPTTGTNSLRPGVPKYEAKAEDGEVSFCWHINTLESMWSKPKEVSIHRAIEEKFSNMMRKTVSDDKVEFLAKTSFTNFNISDQDHKVKTESLVTVTAPTNGTNSLKPGEPKYEAKTEDGVSFYWQGSRWSKPNTSDTISSSMPVIMSEIQSSGHLWKKDFLKRAGDVESNPGPNSRYRLLDIL